MKTKLTCPNCGAEHEYSDSTYNRGVPGEDEYVGGEINIEVCKSCGYNFEFIIEVITIDENEVGL